MMTVVQKGKREVKVKTLIDRKKAELRRQAPTFLLNINYGLFIIRYCKNVPLWDNEYRPHITITFKMSNTKKTSKKVVNFPMKNAALI